MPLPEEQYLLHASPEDGSPTAAWPILIRGSRLAVDLLDRLEASPLIPCCVERALEALSSDRNIPAATAYLGPGGPGPTPAQRRTG